MRGRTVLDFASGCGIAGIAAARAGALSVLCADIDPLAEAACRLNGESNRVSIHTTTDDLVGADLLPDVVLAGDICYERALAERVIALAYRPFGARRLVLVGDPGRAYLPTSRLNAIKNYSVATSIDLEDRTLRRTDVYRLVA